MSSYQAQLKRRRENSENEEMSANSTISAVSEPERRTSSPDIFSDFMEQVSSASMEDDTETEKLDKLDSSVADALEENLNENLKQELNADATTCQGCSIEELKSGLGVWGYPQLPPVRPSNKHAVLFQLPLLKGEKPAPLQRPYVDKWDSNHVRMPFSPQNLCPDARSGSGSKGSLRSVWELVEEALLRHIVSSQQLEAAILSYGTVYGQHSDFTTLHYFLSDALDEAEVNCFFSQLLPSMIQLALQLPSLVKGSIPLLKQFKNSSVSLSQLQIASLLSNAFFCTFPRRNALLRNTEYATFPDINFNRLFQSKKKKSNQRAVEKLKCILHYFRRVCHKAPEGVVTYTRRYLPAENLPAWEKSSKLLNKLHITSCGTIEDEGIGMLQVDFANKRVGGGVLQWGCVQEEIRFVICPELIISRLFTDSMEPLEALHIVGCERFSNYKGYGDSFEWTGDYCDNTPRDTSERLLCSMTAIDAMAFRNPNIQYTANNIARELNKAYVGFSSPDVPEDQRSPVATGNWGCGVYRGNPKLKSLLQLMAASQAGRHLVYFTFGNETLRDEVFQMYTFLVDNRVTVGKLWHYLNQYPDRCLRDGKPNTELYTYLYKRISESENSIHFTGTDQPANSANTVSKCNAKLNLKAEDQRLAPDLNIFKQVGNVRGRLGKKLQINSIASSTDKQGEQKSAEIVSEYSAPHSPKKNVGTLAVKTLHTDIMEVTNLDRQERTIDEFSRPTGTKSKSVSTSSKTSLLEQLQSYDKIEIPNSTINPKKKISDYFTTVQK